MNWVSPSLLLYGGLALCSLCILCNTTLWYFGRRISKLNRTYHTFLVSLIWQCMLLSVLSYPATLIELYTITLHEDDPFTTFESASSSILASASATGTLDSVEQISGSSATVEGLVEVTSNGTTTTTTSALEEEETATSLEEYAYQVFTALTLMLQGMIPWMVCCISINYNVRKLSYKFLLGEMLISILIPFVLSFARVTAPENSYGQLILTFFYNCLCTLIPFACVALNFVYRWRSQIKQTRSSSSTILSVSTVYGLCAALFLTYLPADLLEILVLMLKHEILAPTDSLFDLALLSPCTMFIIRYLKFIFLALFPFVLALSGEFKSAYLIEIGKQFSGLTTMLHKASQRASVSSAYGMGKTSYNMSVVINDHDGCIETYRENAELGEENTATPDPTISLSIDIHQLHVSLDASCPACKKLVLGKTHFRGLEEGSGRGAGNTGSTGSTSATGSAGTSSTTGSHTAISTVLPMSAVPIMDKVKPLRTSADTGTLKRVEFIPYDMSKIPLEDV